MIEPVKERDIVNYKESKENNWKKVFEHSNTDL